MKVKVEIKDLRVRPVGTLLVVLIAMAMILTGCGSPAVPDNAEAVPGQPDIYPDYKDVTVPGNICPMNFYVRNCEEAVARLSVGDKSYVYGDGDAIVIDEDEWAELRDAAKGKDIRVEVFAKRNGGWKAYKAFSINVAQEDIDPYISYRLILPSYVAYEDLTIAQRNLTNFEEEDIYTNRAIDTEETAQCINCHSYQNYGTDRMLFHMRQGFGGTMIYDNGTLKKVDLKTAETLSAGVYPAWHPTLNIVAFSTNITGQSFHTKGQNKIEVQDTESDLILYDVEKNEVMNICNDTTELEVFPTWSPDGKTLYYCSARYIYKDSVTKDTEMIEHYREVQYNIYKKSFDEKTRRFGETQLVYDAVADSLSATLPRISPDGRYMVCSLGAFGCFHVWHDDADIYLFDLKSGERRNLELLNSPHSESYPSFSSNGRWVMADSRRDDGNYTRPVISYFDKSGKCYKAFVVPQKDPHFYDAFVKCYNRPEFMKEAVKTTVRELVSKAKTDPVKAVFKK